MSGHVTHLMRCSKIPVSVLHLLGSCALTVCLVLDGLGSALLRGDQLLTHALRAAQIQDLLSGL